MPTRSELRAIVRQDELLNDTGVISDVNLNTLLGEGAVQFAKDADAFIKTASWNTVANTSDYVLSGASPKTSGFLGVYWPTGGVIYAPTSTTTKLPNVDFDVVSEVWLNREQPGWRGLSASDTLRFLALSFDSDGNLILKMVPKASSATPQFTLSYVSRGTDMSADANYPYLDSTTNLTHIEPFTKGIAYWAMHVLHRDKTKIDGEADRYLKLYAGIASACKESQRHLFEAETVGLRERARLDASQTFGGL